MIVLAIIQIISCLTITMLIVNRIASERSTRPMISLRNTLTSQHLLVIVILKILVTVWLVLVRALQMLTLVLLLLDLKHSLIILLCITSTYDRA